MVIKDNRKRLEEVEKCEADIDDEIEDVFKHIKLDICRFVEESHGSDVFNDEILEVPETIVPVTDEFFYSSSEDSEEEDMGDEDSDAGQW